MQTAEVAGRWMEPGGWSRGGGAWKRTARSGGERGPASDFGVRRAQGDIILKVVCTPANIHWHTCTLVDTSRHVARRRTKRCGAWNHGGTQGQASWDMVHCAQMTKRVS